jgi:hypothetical protein
MLSNPVLSTDVVGQIVLVVVRQWGEGGVRG